MWLRLLPGLALFPALLMAEEAPTRTSLLFTPAESAAIGKALSEVGRPQLAAPTSTEPNRPVIPNIYLSAIAEFGPGHWTVWANGYRIAPGHQPPGFEIVAVHDDRVDIAVASDPPARFSLQPHQTWLSRSNSVVEGIFP